MSNQRFSEYATSGAFTISLSRNQVATLAIVADGGDVGYGMSGSSLERRGLIEPVANPSDFVNQLDRVEYRATMAGLLCASLVREAGLSNGPPDPVAAELATLRREIEARRLEAATARRDARSAMARLQESEAELASVRADLSLAEAGIRLREEVRRNRPFAVRLRDPAPERSNEQLLADVQEPA